MISISLVSESFKDVEGIISSLTFDPLGPLIRSTTSSILQPITSIISPNSSCPTPIILSLGFKDSVFSAGPPGTSEEIEVYKPSEESRAPIPSKDKLMLISKSSEFLGDI